MLVIKLKPQMMIMENTLMASINGVKQSVPFRVIDVRNKSELCRSSEGKNKGCGVVFCVNIEGKYTLLWITRKNVRYTAVEWHRCWLSRFIFLSPVEFNCTYDIRDPMKGLNAQCSIREISNLLEIKVVSNGNLRDINEFKTEIPLYLFDDILGS